MLGGAKVTFIVEDDKGTVDGDVSMIWNCAGKTEFATFGEDSA